MGIVPHLESEKNLGNPLKFPLAYKNATLKTKVGQTLFSVAVATIEQDAGKCNDNIKPTLFDNVGPNLRTKVDPILLPKVGQTSFSIFGPTMEKDAGHCYRHASLPGHWLTKLGRPFEGWPDCGRLAYSHLGSWFFCIYLLAFKIKCKSHPCKNSRVSWGTVGLCCFEKM